ncbi:MAG: lipoprotein signal peptidase [Crocinitomicaceae bacterium]|nr:MAG: lipoprotein signal peptidase [Crocinitomicaceae bacterium]
MKKNLMIVGALVALILLIDQLVKIYVKTHFQPGDSVNVFGDWFVIEYIENQGMAFGTTFGNKIWHKLALSIFRIFAIGGICYYWYQQAKAGVKREFLVAIGLILAGATGNLIDSMFYDYAFPYDPCMGYNHLEGSGVFADCGFFGKIETKHRGFLLGNVVDMYKFHATWPQWVPWLGGSEVFPAIWNTADASITIGVGMVFLRQRAYFPKKRKEQVVVNNEQESKEIKRDIE